MCMKILNNRDKQEEASRQKIIEQLMSENEELKKRVDSLEKTNAGEEKQQQENHEEKTPEQQEGTSTNNHSETPIAEEEPLKPTAPRPADDAKNANESTDELKAMLSRIEQRMEELSKPTCTFGEKAIMWQEKYEKLYQNVQEDRYRKDKVKLAGRMIHHVDLLRRMLYDFNSNRDNSHAKDEETLFLEKQIEMIIAAMDDTLQHEMVMTRPMAQEGVIFDDEYMEAIDTVPTDDPALDGKVYRSVSACYYWTLPYILKARIDEKGDEVRSYNFMIHPEEVIIYKLNK